jgi:hypothetical protein
VPIMLVTRLVGLIRRGNMIRPHNLHRTLVMTAAVDVPRFTFNNGVRVPSVGLGCVGPGRTARIADGARGDAGWARPAGVHACMRW